MNEEIRITLGLISFVLLYFTYWSWTKPRKKDENDIVELFGFFSLTT